MFRHFNKSMIEDPTNARFSDSYFRFCSFIPLITFSLKGICRSRSTFTGYFDSDSNMQMRFQECDAVPEVLTSQSQEKCSMFKNLFFVLRGSSVAVSNFLLFLVTPSKIVLKRTSPSCVLTSSSLCNRSEIVCTLSRYPEQINN